MNIMTWRRDEIKEVPSPDTAIWCVVLAMAILSPVTSTDTKSYAVVCMNMGSSVSPTVTVAISGAMDEVFSLLNAPIPVITNTTSFSQPSRQIYRFHQYQDVWQYQSRCVNNTGLAEYGVYFVESSISLHTEQQTVMTHITYTAENMAESYTAIPISKLGLKYLAITFCELYGHCQIFVAITENNTEIEITLPNNMDVSNVKYGNQSLHKGDKIYEGDLSEGNSILLECECDLTGTVVESDKKVAVFSGSRNAVVGIEGRENFLIEQIPPLTKWGREYGITCSHLLCGEEGAFIKILTESPTTIKITGYGTLRTTGSKSWIHRRIEQNDFLYVTSDNPILVAMFLLNDGDLPSTMILIPPLEGRSTTSGFQKPDPFDGDLHLALIAPTVMGSYVLNGLNHATDVSDKLLQNSAFFAHPVNLSGPDRNYLFDSSPHAVGIYGVVQGEINGEKVRLSVSNGLYHEAQEPMTYFNLTDDSCTVYGLFPPPNCEALHGSKLDEKGRFFLIVFPFFEEPVHFSVDVMSSEENGINPNVDDRGQGCVGELCTTIRESKDNKTWSRKYQNCVCMGMNSTGVFGSGTLLSFDTNGEFTVVVSVMGSITMATYLAFPVDVLGMEYYTVTYCTEDNSCGCTVSAIYNHTIVRIRLHSGFKGKVTYNAKEYGRGKSIELELLELHTFMFVSEKDLTGTYITSSAPVAVVCGGRTPKGTFLEQIPHVSSLENTYSVPVWPHTFARVIATDGNTVVTGTGTIQQNAFLLEAGSYFDFDSAISLSRLVATKPILAVGLFDDKIQDGFMVTLISNKRYTKEHFAKFPFNINRTDQHVYVFLSKDTENVTVRAYVGSSSTGYQSYAIQSGRERHYQEEISNQVGVDISSGYALSSVLIVGRPTGNAAAMYGTTLGRRLTDFEVCSLTPQTNIADQEDNDCDGLIDEEICVKNIYKHDKQGYINTGKYIPDFDLDGMLDEDCYSEIPVPSSTESSSMMTTVISSDIAISPTLSESTSALLTTSSPTSFSSTSTQPLTTYASITPSSTLLSFSSTSSLLSSSSTASSPATSSSTTSSPSTATTSSFSSSTTSSLSTTITSPMSLPSSSTSFVTSTTFMTTSTPTSKVCWCPCNRFKPPNPELVNITHEKLVTIVEETKKKLAVNKSSLSSFIRKKISAGDSRTSAQGIGYLGIFILVFVGFCIVGMDLAFIKQHIRAIRSFGR